MFQNNIESTSIVFDTIELLSSESNNLSFSLCHILFLNFSRFLIFVISYFCNCSTFTCKAVGDHEKNSID